MGLREPSLGAVERPVPSRLANEDAASLEQTNSAAPTECTQYGVYSVSNGTVRRVSWQDDSHRNRGLGFRISVFDSTGYMQYGHMDPYTIAVGVGDSVSVGTYLGDYANPTNGSSSGPHVHVERRPLSNPSTTIFPGDMSPLGSGGRATSPWQAQDSPLHVRPHQGVDYAYPEGGQGCP